MSSSRVTEFSTEINDPNCFSESFVADFNKLTAQFYSISELKNPQENGQLLTSDDIFFDQHALEYQIDENYLHPCNQFVQHDNNGIGEKINLVNQLEALLNQEYEKIKSQNKSLFSFNHHEKDLALEKIAEKKRQITRVKQGLAESLYQRCIKGMAGKNLTEQRFGRFMQYIQENGNYTVFNLLRSDAQDFINFIKQKQQENEIVNREFIWPISLIFNSAKVFFNEKLVCGERLNWFEKLFLYKTNEYKFQDKYLHAMGKEVSGQLSKESGDLKIIVDTLQRDPASKVALPDKITSKFIGEYNSRDGKKTALIPGGLAQLVDDANFSDLCDEFSLLNPDFPTNSHMNVHYKTTVIRYFINNTQGFKSFVDHYIEENKNNLNDKKRCFIQYLKRFNRELDNPFCHLSTRLQHRIDNAIGYLNELIFQGVNDFTVANMVHYIDLIVFAIETGRVSLECIKVEESRNDGTITERCLKEQERQDYLTAIRLLKGIIEGTLFELKPEEIELIKSLAVSKRALMSMQKENPLNYLVTHFTRYHLNKQLNRSDFYGSLYEQCKSLKSDCDKAAQYFIFISKFSTEHDVEELYQRTVAESFRFFRFVFEVPCGKEITLKGRGNSVDEFNQDNFIKQYRRIKLFKKAHERIIAEVDSYIQAYDGTNAHYAEILSVVATDEQLQFYAKKMLEVALKNEKISLGKEQETFLLENHAIILPVIHESLNNFIEKSDFVWNRSAQHGIDKLGTRSNKFRYNNKRIAELLPLVSADEFQRNSDLRKKVRSCMDDLLAYRDKGVAYPDDDALSELSNIFETHIKSSYPKDSPHWDMSSDEMASYFLVKNPKVLQSLRLNKVSHVLNGSFKSDIRYAQAVWFVEYVNHSSRPSFICSEEGQSFFDQLIYQDIAKFGWQEHTQIFVSAWGTAECLDACYLSRLNYLIKKNDPLETELHIKQLKKEGILVGTLFKTELGKRKAMNELRALIDGNLWSPNIELLVKFFEPTEQNNTLVHDCRIKRLKEICSGTGKPVGHFDIAVNKDEHETWEFQRQEKSRYDALRSMFGERYADLEKLKQYFGKNNIETLKSEAKKFVLGDKINVDPWAHDLFSILISEAFGNEVIRKNKITGQDETLYQIWVTELKEKELASNIAISVNEIRSALQAGDAAKGASIYKSHVKDKEAFSEIQLGNSAIYEGRVVQAIEICVLELTSDRIAYDESSEKFYKEVKLAASRWLESRHDIHDFQAFIDCVVTKKYLFPRINSHPIKETLTKLILLSHEANDAADRFAQDIIQHNVSADIREKINDIGINFVSIFSSVTRKRHLSYRVENALDIRDAHRAILTSLGDLTHDDVSQRKNTFCITPSDITFFRKGLDKKHQLSVFQKLRQAKRIHKNNVYLSRFLSDLNDLLRAEDDQCDLSKYTHVYEIFTSYERVLSFVTRLGVYQQEHFFVSEKDFLAIQCFFAEGSTAPYRDQILSQLEMAVNFDVCVAPLCQAIKHCFFDVNSASCDYSTLKTLAESYANYQGIMAKVVLFRNDLQENQNISITADEVTILLQSDAAMQASVMLNLATLTYRGDLLDFAGELIERFATTNIRNNCYQSTAECLVKQLYCFLELKPVSDSDAYLFAATFKQLQQLMNAHNCLPASSLSDLTHAALHNLKCLAYVELPKTAEKVNDYFIILLANVLYNTDTANQADTYLKLRDSLKKVKDSDASQQCISILNALSVSVSGSPQQYLQLVRIKAYLENTEMSLATMACKTFSMLTINKVISLNKLHTAFNKLNEAASLGELAQVEGYLNAFVESFIVLKSQGKSLPCGDEFARQVIQAFANDAMKLKAKPYWEHTASKQQSQNRYVWQGIMTTLNRVSSKVSPEGNVAITPALVNKYV